MIKVKKFKTASLDNNQAIYLNQIITTQKSGSQYFKRFAGLVKAIKFYTVILTPPHVI